MMTEKTQEQQVLEVEVRALRAELNALKQDAAEPRVLEKSLVETRDLFNILTENMYDAMVIIEWDGTILYANAAAFDLVEMDPARGAADMNIFEFVSPDTRQIVRNDINRVRNGTDGFAAEYKVISLKGREQWVEGLGKRITFQGRNVDLVTMRDITDRKQIEHALMERQAKLDSIFTAAPTGIGLTVNRNLIEVNDRICEMTGYTREELIGKSSLILYPSQEAYDRVGNEKYGRIREYGTGSVETQWRRKDGTIIDVLLSSTPLNRADLSVGVTFTVLDITERKQAEEVLRRSEERFRSMIQNSSDLIVILNGEGIITYQTPSVERILGYEDGHFIGKNPFDFIHPEDIEKVAKDLSEVYGDSNPLIPTEMRIRKDDGSWIYLEALGKNLINFPGINGVVLTARDITERKKSERERIDMQRKLLHAQKLESLGVMAGGIAHDFNNLLMAIMGNLDLALVDLSSIHLVQDFISQALTAVQRAADLTNQMLTYSGKGTFDLRSLKISSLVEEMAHLFRASISKSATLHLALSRKLPPIIADPGQIQQIIMNLIVNASDAIGEHQGNIYITTGEMECDAHYLAQSRLKEKAPAGRYVFVEVRDTGCGMDDQTQEKLFDPFFTTKITGRGLGMAAVLGIVGGHCGAIIVQSKPGVGTTIRVLFPIRALGETPRVGRTDGVAIAVPEPHTRLDPGTVLVVDDEEVLRDLCNTMVARLGYQVLTAADGLEAVDVYRAHAAEISCVILDMTMPKMDGVETFRELLRIKSDVRVIISSGFSEQEIAERFRGRELAGIIKKPFMFQDLKSALVKAMGTPTTAS